MTSRVNRLRMRRRRAGWTRLDIWVPGDFAETARAALRGLTRHDPPTPQQLAYAEELARRTGQALPDLARANAAACVLWIAVHRAS